MPYLSDTQRNLLAPAGQPHPRNGATVPTSQQAPFVNAACWGWALNGEYVNADDPYAATTIYTSDNGAFVFNAERVPTGLNADFFAVTDVIFPQTMPYHTTLAANFANALGGNVAAQDACRFALMKLTAELNGHTVLPDNGSAVYTMVMKSPSWYGWCHWGIGIQGAGGGDTTYQQKVNGSVLNPNTLQYNCGVMWDEGQPLTTTIRIDGLLQTQVTMLNRVV